MNVRARPTPSTPKIIGDIERGDERKLLRDVKAAKASDAAKGTGPRRNSPKSFHDVPGPDLAPDVETKSDVETKPDLHSALMDVADKLMDGPHDRPATLGHLAWALHSVAAKIKPKSTPEMEPDHD
jgi:hypothetical protein